MPTLWFIFASRALCLGLVRGRKYERKGSHRHRCGTIQRNVLDDCVVLMSPITGAAGEAPRSDPGTGRHPGDCATEQHHFHRYAHRENHGRESAVAGGEGDHVACIGKGPLAIMLY